jgi:hypothetical protein
VLARENPLTFETGGGFVLIRVKCDKNGIINIQNIDATNKVIESTLLRFFSARKQQINVTMKEDQLYIVPVLYIALNSNTDEPSWKNNDYYSLRDFGNVIVPDNTLALQPIVIMMSSSIR